MRAINPAAALVPYIVGAAVAAFALSYCIRSVAAGLNAPDRIGVQSEPAQPLHIVDRSHKGDRFSGGPRVNDQAAAGGNVELFPTMVTHSNPRLSPSLRAELPDGCESAFSPLSAAEQKDLAARCLT
jgi:hypothetical protein